jgi:hypothetical protein
MSRRLSGAAIAVGLTVTGCRGCSERNERGAPPPPSALPSSVPSASSSAKVVGRPPKSPLRRRIDQAQKYDSKPFVPATAAELTAYGAWFSEVLGSALTDRLPQAAPPAGFAGRFTDRGELWVLAEADDTRRGAGLAALRPGKSRPFLIEAPHCFFDRGTLEIALAVFERLEGRALLVNTMNRSSAGTAEERMDEARRGSSPSDLAHVEESFYSTAHAELVRADPELVAIQIHGFKDDHVPGTAAVVSASKTRGDARSVAIALRQAFPSMTFKIFPEEVDTLGGTQNRQAELSRAARAPFVHVELSATLRTALNSDAALTERFADALAAAKGTAAR